MRELFGRLIELDPAASDALQVIEYFDRLVSARAGSTALLREAAVLARSTVGYESPKKRRRFLASGAEASAGTTPEDALIAEVADGSRVWLAVDASTIPTARVVLDRLAIALRLGERWGLDDGATRSAVAVLLAAALPGDDPAARTSALGRLRLEQGGQFRALALPLEVACPPGWPQTLVETPWGLIRGVIAPVGVTWTAAGGVGTVADGHHLDVSWQRALVALRLSDLQSPVEADSLGSLLLALEPTGSDDLRRAEVARISAALRHHWTPPELAAVAEGHSLRAIASISGLHHSTITDRLARLPALLGFDPQSMPGRARLLVALMLYRLHLPTVLDRPAL